MRLRSSAVLGALAANCTPLHLTVLRALERNWLRAHGDTPGPRNQLRKNSSSEVLANHKTAVTP
ncbi:hypothetical protein [Nocardiopsis sp. RV163]|uniref:hypothetical protein n=1 Tax=Nocardiopsis sp. RV163 TaxID=1661388 RepID=UPI000AC6ABEF|nr:hypothetical protein [Nocardiopsis sp. RV163]